MTIRPSGKSAGGSAGPSENGTAPVAQVPQLSVETWMFPPDILTQIVHGGVEQPPPYPSCFTNSSSACTQPPAIVHKRAVFWLFHDGLLPIRARVLLIVDQDASEITVRRTIATCTSIMLKPPSARRDGLDRIIGSAPFAVQASWADRGQARGRPDGDVRRLASECDGNRVRVRVGKLRRPR